MKAWLDPEAPMKLNTDHLGDLVPTAEEAAVVSFIKTISDGYIVIQF
jgi:hypothetical protein